MILSRLFGESLAMASGARPEFLRACFVASLRLMRVGRGEGLDGGAMVKGGCEQVGVRKGERPAERERGGGRRGVSVYVNSDVKVTNCRISARLRHAVKDSPN